MSWKATAYVAELTENITRSEKLVLLCISNRFNDDEACAWVSVPKLARESLMSERTAQRAMDGLVEKGFLEIGQRPGQSSVYLIKGLSDKEPTPVKTAGVSNWQTKARPRREMSPHPRQTQQRNVTPPPSKELITSDNLDTNGADEQRTVNEPYIEPSENRQSRGSIATRSREGAVRSINVGDGAANAPPARPGPGDRPPSVAGIIQRRSNSRRR